WSFEMQAIQADMAGGWRADSVKPRDKGSIEFYPLKDGARGGQLVSAVLASGTKLGGAVRRARAPDWSLRFTHLEELMNVKAIMLAGVAVIIAAPAFAHHSFAMFDRTKVVNITGTVKEYEWTNPHVWIHINAPDEKGAMREWGFEMQAIAQ